MSEKIKDQNTQIVVVGGGFGGVKTALELSKNKQFSVTLVSDREDFRYNPTLFHTATGGLFKQSSIPLKHILEGGRINFIHGKLVKLDRNTDSIELDNGSVMSYDKLVLALGVVTNYFGIEGLQEHTYGIKSIEEVAEFKQHLHTLLEDDKKPDVNYLIVGAGPTGIELAGALPAYLKKVMKNHKLRHKKVNVQIIEAAPRLLPHSSPFISKAVAKRLQKLGVKLKLNKKVEGADAANLMVDGEPIPSKTIVWTAGASNHPFFKENSFHLTEKGKVAVDEHLMTEKNIYVIGDNANTPHSGYAQTALYDAHYVSRDIEANFHGHEGDPYRPRTPASVVPVGQGWASFEWGIFKLTGRLGWIMRQAADWIGYHDIEPWWKANEQWLTEFGEEESCVICAKNS